MSDHALYTTAMPAESASAHRSARRLGNHPQIERLLRLGPLLRSGTGHAAVLAERLEVSERTIRRDLEFARDRLDWPVKYEARRRVWVLLSDPPTLPAIPLSEAEMFSVLVAARALEAYRGTPYAAPLASGFAKILAALGATPGVGHLDLDALPVFDLDPTREVAPALYSQLHRACRERQRLELTYHTPSHPEVNVRRIDPYHLLNHAGDWYLVAYCHLRGGMRDFAVGTRMLQVQLTGETFQPDPEFDLEKYLKTGFSLFKSGDLDTVVLRFTPEQALYIRERKWAVDEAKRDLPDGGLILTFRTRINIGLVQFISKYGPEVEVQAPDSLRQVVAARLRKAAAIYSGGTDASE